MTEERFNRLNDIYERLAGDARMRHVDPGMADPQTAEDLKRARTLVNNAIERGMITAAALAKRTGIKETAISEFRNTKWHGKKAVEVGTRQRLRDSLPAAPSARPKMSMLSRADGGGRDVCPEPLLLNPCENSRYRRQHPHVSVRASSVNLRVGVFRYDPSTSGNDTVLGLWAFREQRHFSRMLRYSEGDPVGSVR